MDEKQIIRNFKSELESLKGVVGSVSVNRWKNMIDQLTEQGGGDTDPSMICPMKYCKCKSPKEWDGDNYCQECDGLIEARLSSDLTVREVVEYVKNDPTCFHVLIKESTNIKSLTKIVRTNQ